MSKFVKGRNTAPKKKGAKKLKAAGSGGMALGLQKKGARKLGSVDVPDAFRSRIKTGYEHLDMFFSAGGGLCPIQSISINAPRGGGKTTLWLQIAQGIFDATQGDKEVLYGSGEEYVEQLALSAERLGTVDVCADNITLVEDYLAEIESGKWCAIVIDSVPCLSTNLRVNDEGEAIRKKDVSAAEWRSATKITKGQMDEFAVSTLVAAGKKNGVIPIFVMHQTKDNKIKGSSQVEHTVDTCLNIVVPKDSDIEKGLFPYGMKLLCCDKNRFGGTGMLAMMMGEKGWELDKPWEQYSHDPGNSKEGPGVSPRAAKKVREQQNILDVIKTAFAPMTSQEIIKKVLGNPKDCDPTDWERHERHIKALEKMGKVLRSGGGRGKKTKAVYSKVL